VGGNLRPSDRALEILKHFVANPLAADSLEGIAGWRLLEDLVQRRVEETTVALQWLVAHGFLDRSAGGAAPPLYRLNAARRRDAEQVLANAGEPPAAPGGTNE
jgi:hypothetical protein